ncbi:hypothetical protein AZE42_10795 [Rhizopogon vesiculosus]|uniref:RBR-type E3 ubiquitin transferase n=1 Tax=Rhizopogon vesiculosus TaxID=180088 RepID=A0A1J8PSI1_9AGAM|nr:hypothetical protein AZE42_10795 [Rhizopogon vesiculosus]
MITQMNFPDIERFQTSYGTRMRRGQALSDRGMSFALLVQNAREIADLDADWEVAQRLALKEGWEPANDPVPTSCCAPSCRQEVGFPVCNPPVQFPDKSFRGKSKKRRRSKSSASLSVMPTSSGPTPSSPSQVPTITTRVPRRATGHDCVICQDPIFGPEILAPCGHFYDIGCITDLFRAATRDDSLYPPLYCHQDIPSPQVRPHLTQALLAEFELKAQEFGTLKRVYCAAPACGRLLGSLYEGLFFKIFTCPSPTCTMATCRKCGEKYDGWNHNCTLDAEIERVLTLSRKSGWSRCPGCAQMIELNMGCYHMTCRCKTEFCYLCRASWTHQYLLLFERVYGSRFLRGMRAIGAQVFYIHSPHLLLI